MDRGLTVILGMLVAYVFAFLGLVFAWIGYNRRKREAARRSQDEPHG
jgi:hypothetical protein